MIIKEESFNNLSLQFTEIEKALREKEDALNNVTRERDDCKSRYKELLPGVNTEATTFVNPDSISACSRNTDDIQWQADISVTLPTVNCSLCGAGERELNV